METPQLLFPCVQIEFCGFKHFKWFYTLVYTVNHALVFLPWKVVPAFEFVLAGEKAVR